MTTISIKWLNSKLNETNNQFFISHRETVEGGGEVREWREK